MGSAPLDIDVIFAAAMEIPSPADRQAYLSKACGGDVPLKQRIEKLLGAHFRAGGFMQSAADGLLPTTDGAACERPGAMIGRYKLLEPIGEGGFGVVFMAEQQEPVRRKVALKVIKAGMDTRQVIARFEAERQALALMDHPNIARVLDAGATESGRPYFVMELVNGIPLTDYCDRNQLTARERLALFVQVCQAVQHAHQKGIIHRDIKPTNVLVTLHDGQPVPKVIDFGIAKAAGQQLTEKTLFTSFQQMVGTPLYMSPEQAEMSGLDVDTRADIYSLGVLLYELLTGTTPFDRERLRKAAYEEIRRIIREEEPPRPSTRLSTMGQAATAVSANRKSDPKRLGQTIRGELDWIVMKALEKDRGRRYETASGLAMDVHRYLRDQTVHACPPTAGYRLRKFIRRNQRVAVAASVILLAALLGLGAVAGSIGWVARDRAARRLGIEQVVGSALRDAAQFQKRGQWYDALVAARRAQAAVAGGGADQTLALQVGKLVVDLELVERVEEIRLRAHEVRRGDLDLMAIDQEHAAAFRNAGIDIDALPPAGAAQRLAERGQVCVALAAALDTWAVIRVELNNKPGSQALVTLAMAIDPEPWRQRVRQAVLDKDRRTLETLADSDDLPRQAPITVALLAYTLSGFGDRERAIQVLRQGQQEHPADFWLNNHLGLQLAAKGPAHLAEAVGFHRAAVATRPRSAVALLNLGACLADVGLADQAIACYQKAIVLEPGFAPLYTNLGNALADEGHVNDAIIAHRKAIALAPNVALAHYNLGVVFDARGQLNDAIACYRRAVQLDPTDPAAIGNLGAALTASRLFDEALAPLRKAIELRPDEPSYRNNLGVWYKRQGRLDEAIEAHRDAIRVSPGDAPSHYSLGTCVGTKGLHQEALDSFRTAIELKPDYAEAHASIGTALGNLGRHDEAIAAYRKAVELRPGHADLQRLLSAALSRRPERPATDALQPRTGR